MAPTDNEVPYVIAQERHFEDGLEQEDVARANSLIGQLAARNHSLDWVSAYDAVKCVKYEPGESYSHNEKTNGTLIVPSLEHAAVWELEVLGQISDGAWENHWWDFTEDDAWENYFEMDVVIDEDADTVTAHDAYIPDDLDYSDVMTDFDESVGRIAFYIAMVTGSIVSKDNVTSLLEDFEGL